MLPAPASPEDGVLLVIQSRKAPAFVPPGGGATATTPRSAFDAGVLDADGGRLAIIDRLGRLDVVETASGAFRRVAELGVPARLLQFSEAARDVVFLTVDANTRAYDLRSGNMVSSVGKHKQDVHSLCQSSGGATLLTASSEAAYMWAVASSSGALKVERRLPGQVGIAAATLLSEAGLVAIAFADDQVVVWRLADFEPVARLRLPEVEAGAGLAHLAGAPDGSLLIAGGANNGCVYIWELASQALVRVIDMPAPARAVVQLHYIPADKAPAPSGGYGGGVVGPLLVLLGDDGRLRVVRVGPASCVAELELEASTLPVPAGAAAAGVDAASASGLLGGVITSFSCSADGRVLAVTTTDGRAVVLDLERAIRFQASAASSSSTSSASAAAAAAAAAAEAQAAEATRLEQEAVLQAHAQEVQQAQAAAAAGLGATLSHLASTAAASEADLDAAAAAAAAAVHHLRTLREAQPLFPPETGDTRLDTSLPSAPGSGVGGEDNDDEEEDEELVTGSLDEEPAAKVPSGPAPPPSSDLFERDGEGVVVGHPELAHAARGAPSMGHLPDGLHRTRPAPPAPAAPQRLPSSAPLAELLAQVLAVPPHPAEVVAGTAPASPLPAAAGRVHRVLAGLLKQRGQYPAAHRPLVWRLLLRLPANTAAYAALAGAPVPAEWADLAVRFPVRDRRLAARLATAVAGIARLSPAPAGLGGIPSLPLAVFPIVKAFATAPSGSALTDDVHGFEAALAVLGNYARDWVETLPYPPLPLLARIHVLLAYWDNALASHLEACGADPVRYAWPLLRSLLSEPLPRGEWEALWDHLLTRCSDPSLLPYAVVAYLRHVRKDLLAITPHPPPGPAPHPGATWADGRGGTHGPFGSGRSGAAPGPALVPTGQPGFSGVQAAAPFAVTTSALQVATCLRRQAAVPVWSLWKMTTDMRAKTPAWAHIYPPPPAAPEQPSGPLGAQGPLRRDGPVGGTVTTPVRYSVTGWPISGLTPPTPAEAAAAATLAHPPPAEAGPAFPLPRGGYTDPVGPSAGVAAFPPPPAAAEQTSSASSTAPGGVWHSVPYIHAVRDRILLEDEARARAAGEAGSCTAAAEAAAAAAEALRVQAAAGAAVAARDAAARSRLSAVRAAEEDALLAALASRKTAELDAATRAAAASLEAAAANRAAADAAHQAALQSLNEDAERARRRRLQTMAVLTAERAAADRIRALHAAAVQEGQEAAALAAGAVADRAALIAAAEADAQQAWRAWEAQEAAAEAAAAEAAAAAATAAVGRQASAEVTRLVTAAEATVGALHAARSAHVAAAADAVTRDARAAAVQEAVAASTAAAAATVANVAEAVGHVVDSAAAAAQLAAARAAALAAQYAPGVEAGAAVEVKEEEEAPAAPAPVPAPEPVPEVAAPATPVPVAAAEAVAPAPAPPAPVVAMPPTPPSPPTPAPVAPAAPGLLAPLTASMVDVNKRLEALHAAEATATLAEQRALNQVARAYKAASERSLSASRLASSSADASFDGGASGGGLDLSLAQRLRPQDLAVPGEPAANDDGAGSWGRGGAASSSTLAHAAAERRHAAGEAPAAPSSNAVAVHAAAGAGTYLQPAPGTPSRVGEVTAASVQAASAAAREAVLAGPAATLAQRLPAPPNPKTPLPARRGGHASEAGPAAAPAVAGTTTASSSAGGSGGLVIGGHVEVVGGAADSSDDE